MTATIQTGRYINNTTDSAKTRLLDAMKDNCDARGWVKIKPSKLAEMAGINEHETVHLLFSLRMNNLVTFRWKDGSSPWRLRLTTTALGTKYRGGKYMMQKTIDNNVREAKKYFAKHPEYASEVSEAPRAVSDALTASEKYPLIARLANRKTNLENAAKLAEESGADDLAIQLYEKANKYSDFELEVINLYNDCRQEKA